MIDTSESTVTRAVCGHDCPDQCSMLATVRDGKLLSVAGDPEHPFTRGWLCAKVAKYEQRVYSPDRLATPLRRTGPKGSGSFAPISWDDALDEIVERWREVARRWGSEALLGYCYSGHMGLINRNLPRALFHALGACRFQAGTVCDSAAEAGWTAAVGRTPGVDPESIVDSDLIIAWGANIPTTNAHLLSFLSEARKKGARFIAIDPHRNRAARHADWHLAPRIGSDAALALGLMHCLFRDGQHDAAYLADHATGLDRLRAEILPAYTPRAVAAITSLEASDVERLADLYGRAAAPFIRLGMGMSRHTRGAMAIRAVASLPAVVGAWTTHGGGALMDTAGIWGFDYDAIRRPDLAPRETRSINHSELGRALTELDNPPLKALFVAANNPTVTCPDAGRVERGLLREDLFTVVHDLFLSDTARFADIVLPATTALETDDLYRSYGTYYTQFGARTIEPVGESRSNARLVADLAARLGLTDPVFSRSPREHVAALLANATGPTAALDIDDLLSGTPVKLPWTSRGPAMTFFVNDALGADQAIIQWRPDPAEANVTPEWPLRLLTVPGHFQAHTAYDGVAFLRKREGEPACLVHPDDATARAIRDGDRVDIVNQAGRVAFRAAVSDAAQPGIVVVESVRARNRHRDGRTLNMLIGDGLTDLGGGATYQSTWIDVRPSQS
ncbi:MAG: molybdopterin oxidoreductase family protein [Chloroflexota bacterium]|nr:MAG: molybdopterin oxidoreductase family protein [Chloroflexota bacterium]